MNYNGTEPDYILLLERFVASSVGISDEPEKHVAREEKLKWKLDDQNPIPEITT